MCGIVGYVGNKSAADVVIAGLKTLEYRGYDSAGVALLDTGTDGNGTNKKARLHKQIGRVEALERLVNESSQNESHLGIGHTRWATHGKPTVINAHPHTNTDQTIFVAHNGIIENYTELRASLQAKGYVFLSETDTEVIPHLIDFYTRSTDNFADAFEKALLDLRGAYAILAMTTTEPETLFAARLSSPLVVGINKNGTTEFVVASDPSAILEHTKEVIYLQDYEMIRISTTGHEIKNIKNAEKVIREIERLDFDANNISKDGYEHFMLKEIHEAPATIRSATLGRVMTETNDIKLGGLESVTQQLRHIDRIVIVACGTSYYASLVGEYLIEELAGIPVEVQQASEFKYRNEPLSRSTAIIAVSQSGETADTIAALKKVEDYGILRLGVVNAVGSTIARMTDAGVYCHAGPEQAVASTKAFIAQVMVLALIALELSNGRSPLYKPLLQELDALPAKAEAVLKQAKAIEAAAHKYKDYRDFLFIGRRYSFPSALEGALKLKEVSYIHAEGYAAGEMKHGPLAMIDKDFPTFALACDSPLLEKTYSNIEEIRARDGKVIAVATEGNKTIANLADDVIYIPETLEATQPILTAIVMQLFSYYVAVAKDMDVDRPRNLAKSVTVE
jgi:glucosamine--fructose-6-phosphate aminotransferase (isomerizing)